MPTEPQPDQKSSRSSLPFEPARRKKTEKKSAVSPLAAKKSESASNRSELSSSRARNSDRSTEMAIPKVVSQRMARRMALFCGIPSTLGILTFFTSYFLVTRDIVALPNTAVLLVSMGCFGLGVLGLSYGVISASWDEEVSGSSLGWSEFNINLGRLTEAWRSNGKNS
jgi:hypothetical protein